MYGGQAPDLHTGRTGETQLPGGNSHGLYKHAAVWRAAEACQRNAQQAMEHGGVSRHRNLIEPVSGTARMGNQGLNALFQLADDHRLQLLYSAGVLAVVVNARENVQAKGFLRIHETAFPQLSAAAQIEKRYSHRCGANIYRCSQGKIVIPQIDKTVLSVYGSHGGVTHEAGEFLYEVQWHDG